jgi:hypothetical protein
MTTAMSVKRKKNYYSVWIRPYWRRPNKLQLSEPYSDKRSNQRYILILENMNVMGSIVKG